MSKLDIIDSVLNEAFKDVSKELIESSRDTKGKKFVMKRQIVNKQIPFSLYRFDIENKEIFPFFKSTGITGLKKMCDYIMFVEDGQHLAIYLIELKKGNISAKKQLDAGKCFAEYLIQTIKRLGLGLNTTNSTLHFQQIGLEKVNRRKNHLDELFNQKLME